MFGRGSLLGTLAAIAFAVTAAPASATVEIHSHNDPAGDPTPLIALPSSRAPRRPLTPVDFAAPMTASTRASARSKGIVVIQRGRPTGWKVADIQCTGPNPAAFTIDVPNGRVTMQHGASEEQICSFTNRGTDRPRGGIGSLGRGARAARRASQPRAAASARGPRCSASRPDRGYAAATASASRGGAR